LRLTTETEDRDIKRERERENTDVVLEIETPRTIGAVSPACFIPPRLFGILGETSFLASCSANAARRDTFFPAFPRLRLIRLYRGRVDPQVADEHAGNYVRTGVLGSARSASGRIALIKFHGKKHSRVSAKPLSPATRAPFLLFAFAFAFRSNGERNERLREAPEQDPTGLSERAALRRPMDHHRIDDACASFSFLVKLFLGRGARFPSPLIKRAPGTLSPGISSSP